MENIKNYFVFFLVISIHTIGYGQSKIVIKQKNDNLKKIRVNSLTDIGGKSITIKNGVNYISGKFELRYYKNRYFVFVLDQFEVLVFSNDLEFEYKFGGKGKGPGEGSYIHSYVINSENDSIILYDSSFRKLVNYNINGTINYEHIIKGKELPYYMSDLLHLTENKFVATGVSSKEWKKINFNKVYNNIYFLKIRKHSIKKIDELSLIPEKIKSGIKNNDIISSNVTNPFKLTKIDKRPCVYSGTSPVVTCMKLNGRRLLKNSTYELDNKFFKRHIEMSENDFMESNRNSLEWISSGNFMIDIFDNGNYIIFHTSTYNKEFKSNNYSIIITEKSDMNIVRVIDYTSRNIIYDISKNELISLFNNKTDTENEGFFSLYRLPINPDI